jgi:ubiquinone/menaquinone biosynthesis C-methylase UbiE
MARKKENWRVWDDNKKYGEVLYNRAIGKRPEMESSKAASSIIKPFMKPGFSILDVGCGAGHYLVSFKKEMGFDFSYTGLDSTSYYIDLAKKAFGRKKDTSFKVGDVYNIPFPDKSFDIVMANNLLQHLPSIAKPIDELCRVAKNQVIVRALVGNRSFRIKDVNKPEIFDKDGEPENFHYYNVYSSEYVGKLLSNIPRVRRYKIIKDTNFSPRSITRAASEQPEAHDVTKMAAGWQVNGYILQPWAFVVIYM